MNSIMYQHPRIYEAFMRILHGRSLEERYRIIADEVGENKRVLDVGCGTGMPADYLKDGCRYTGIDLNKSFIDFARSRGRRIIQGDLFDERNYSDSDVILVCDVLHHVIPNHDRLIDICKRKAGKIIICEPYRSRGVMQNLLQFFRSNRLYHYVFGDSDGINSFEDMVEWNAFEMEDVRSMMESYGAKRIMRLGNHLIGVVDVDGRMASRAS